ncbi:MAG: hypothetical protein ACI81I_000400, partial [Arcobacteraceae bacterium]
MKKIGIVKYLVFALIVILHGCSSTGTSSESSSSLTGSLAKGTVTAATVSAYTVDGILIGKTSEITGSKYSIPLNGYTGTVKVRAYITEYLDEATNLQTKVESLELNAIAKVSSSSTSVNVTALTEIAARLLGINEGIVLSSLSEETIVSTNKLVAYDLTSKEIDSAKDELQILKKNQTDLSDTNKVRYGLALSVISADSNITDETNALSNKNKVNKTISYIVSLIKQNNLLELNNVVEKGLIESNNSITGVLSDVIAPKVDDQNITITMPTVANFTDINISARFEIEENITATNIT